MSENNLNENLLKTQKIQIIPKKIKDIHLKSPNRDKKLITSPEKKLSKTTLKIIVNSPLKNQQTTSPKKIKNINENLLNNNMNKSPKKTPSRNSNQSINNNYENEKKDYIPNTSSEVTHSYDFFKFIKKISNQYKNRKTENSILLEREKYKKLPLKELKKIAINLLNKYKRTFLENEAIIELITRLFPFSEIIKGDDSIISSLSFILQYELQEENTILYKYKEPANQFYIILSGSIDVIVPNEEYMDLTEEEYFAYLLNLRKYQEFEFLNQTLLRNNDKFPMKEESIDIWIKRAFLTVQNIKFKRRQMERFRRLEKNKRKDLHHSIMNFSVVSSDSIHLRGFKPFQSEEERELVMRIELEIEEAYLSISEESSNMQNNIDYNKITSKEYVERIKPIYKVYGKKVPKRRSVLITLLYVSETLKTGNKFGDLPVDNNFNNEDNIRMETIIVSKNSELAYLNKIDYNGVLRDTYEKNREDRLKFLLDLPIFRNANINLFKKNFDRYFKKKIFKYKDIIYKEGQNVDNESHNLYLIVEGNFKIKSELSLNDIDLILLKSSLKRNIDKNELDSLEKFQDYYEKKEIKFETLGKNDIIGLSDCSWNDKYFYTIICNSIEAIVYEIHITYFKMMLNNDENINNNMKELQLTKNHIFLKMLYKQRKSNVRHIKDKHIDNFLLNPKETKDIVVKLNDTVKIRNTIHNYSDILQKKKIETQLNILPKINKEIPLISKRLNSFDSEENSKNNISGRNKKQNRLNNKESLDLSNSENSKPLLVNTFRYHPKTKSGIYKHSLVNNSAINKTNSTDIIGNTFTYNTINNCLLESSRIKKDKDYDFVNNLGKKILNDTQKVIEIDSFNSSKNHTLNNISQKNEGNIINPLAYDDFEKNFNTLDYYFIKNYKHKKPKYNLMFSNLHQPLIKKKLPKDILKREKGVLRGKLYRK